VPRCEDPIRLSHAKAPAAFRAGIPAPEEVDTGGEGEGGVLMSMNTATVSFFLQCR